MCSIGEDDFGDEGGLHAMVAEADALQITSDHGKCNKCAKESKLYKLKFRQAECKECFLVYVNHKFRATLGSSKVLPKNAKVLLIFDGSPEGVVLLDMLYHAQTQNTFKRLHCTAVILYIDDFFLLHSKSNEADHEDHLFELRNHLKRYDDCFEGFITSAAFKQQSPPFYNFKDIKDYLKSDVNNEFIEILDDIRSLTSRQDYVKRLRNCLITSAMTHFDCNFAFLSDISTTLATELLAAVSLGRGGSAALDVSLVDTRLGNGKKLLRPLKDLNDEEVSLYMIARELRPLQLVSYGSDQGPTASLQNMANAFVKNLQANFPSTVSTVSRVGEKIAPNLSSIEVCDFCHSPLDCNDSTTLLAMELSRLVSNVGAASDQCDYLEAIAQRNLNTKPNGKMFSTLCHACHNIKSDCRGVNPPLL